MELIDAEELALSEIEEQGGWTVAYDSDDDMARIYGSIQDMRRFSGVVGTIELDDFILEFHGWCNGQAERRANFNPFTVWQSLFHHLEGAPMRDYSEFDARFRDGIDAFCRFHAPDFRDLFGRSTSSYTS